MAKNRDLVFVGSAQEFGRWLRARRHMRLIRGGRSKVSARASHRKHNGKRAAV